MGQGQLALFFPATISRGSTLMIPTPRFLSGQSRLCSSRFLSFPGGDRTCERKLLEMADTQAMVRDSQELEWPIPGECPITQRSRGLMFSF